MGLKGPDPMETLVGLALRVLVAAVVLGVAFQVCELMGPVARAIACACGVAVMALVPEVAFLASLGSRPGAQ